MPAEVDGQIQSTEPELLFSNPPAEPTLRGQRDASSGLFKLRELQDLDQAKGEGDSQLDRVAAGEGRGSSGLIDIKSLLTESDSADDQPAMRAVPGSLLAQAHPANAAPRPAAPAPAQNNAKRQLLIATVVSLLAVAIMLALKAFA